MIMQSSALIVRNWLYNFYINLWTNVVNVKKTSFTAQWLTIMIKKPEFHKEVSFRCTLTLKSGLELPGFGGSTPPVHVYRRLFLRENLLLISISGQNVEHFDI